MPKPVNLSCRSLFTTACLAAAMLPAIVAEAHLALIPSSGIAGGPVRVDIRVFRGCGDLPTTAVSVKIPEGFRFATPQVKPGWEISTQFDSKTNDAGQVRETLREVTWSGGSLPAKYMDEFSIAGLMPQKPGEEIGFPAVQTCGEAGETREFDLRLLVDPVPEQTETETVEPPDDPPAASSLPALGLGGLALLFSLVALVRTMRRF